MVRIVSSENINVKVGSQKILTPLTSESLALLSEDTLNLLKCVQGVVTDESFSLQAFVEKLEPIIRQNPEYNPAALTQFVIVSNETLQDLLSTMARSEVDYEGADGSVNLTRDAITEEITRVTNKKVRVVRDYLR